MLRFTLSAPPMIHSCWTVLVCLLRLCEFGTAGKFVEIATNSTLYRVITPLGSPGGFHRTVTSITPLTNASSKSFDRTSGGKSTSPGTGNRMKEIEYCYEARRTLADSRRQ